MHLNARANESKFIEKKTIKAEVETLGKDQASKDKKVAKKIVKMDESLTDEERKKNTARFFWERSLPNLLFDDRDESSGQSPRR